jgi:hypothetical protein
MENPSRTAKIFVWSDRLGERQTPAEKSSARRKEKKENVSF